MEYRIIPGYDRKAELSALFYDYTQMLIAGEPDMAPYLEQQGYEEELAHLEGKYGHPYGRLYVAEVEGRVVGCIALRRLSETDCELKRLYVLPELRGHGIARALTRQVIADARAIGYHRVLLDTLPFLREAITLYESEGFHLTRKYNDSPLADDHTLYYCLDL